MPPKHPLRRLRSAFRAPRYAFPYFSICLSNSLRKSSARPQKMLIFVSKSSARDSAARGRDRPAGPARDRFARRRASSPVRVLRPSWLMMLRKKTRKSQSLNWKPRKSSAVLASCARTEVGMMSLLRVTSMR